MPRRRHDNAGKQVLVIIDKLLTKLQSEIILQLQLPCNKFPTHIRIVELPIRRLTKESYLGDTGSITVMGNARSLQTRTYTTLPKQFILWWHILHVKNITEHTIAINFNRNETQSSGSQLWTCIDLCYEESLYTSQSSCRWITRLYNTHSHATKHLICL